jgi:hypothetical protein
VVAVSFTLRNIFDFNTILEELFDFNDDSMVYSLPGSLDSPVYSPPGSFNSPMYSPKAGVSTPFCIHR